MGQWDVTSFHPDHANWGGSRQEDWPNMPDKLLFRLECKGYPVPSYQVPNWYEQGRLVLDWKDLPVRRFTNIPLTLASNAEPWLMEYLRRQDPRISHHDLRARMPDIRISAKGYKRPLGTTSAVSMALQRFRIEEGFPAWTTRQGSDEIAEYVKSLLSKEAIAANSTEELPGLTKRQQVDSRKLNKGKYLNRAGDRLLSAEARAARDADEERRMAKWESKEKSKKPMRASRRFRNVQPTGIFDDEEEPLPNVSDPEPLPESSAAVQTSRRKRTLATGNDFENRAEDQAVKRRRVPGSTFRGDAPMQSQSSSHRVPRASNPQYVNSPQTLNPLTRPFFRPQSQLSSSQPPNSYAQQTSHPFAQRYASAYAPQTAHTTRRQSQQRPQPSQTSNDAMNRAQGLRAAAAAQGYGGEDVPMGAGIPGRRGSGLSHDYRYIRPRNQRDIWSVHEALNIARMRFFEITGCEAPRTPDTESYAVQHSLLRQAVAQVWVIAGPIPPLDMLGPWTGGFDNWNSGDTGNNHRANPDVADYEDWDGY